MVLRATCKCIVKITLIPGKNNKKITFSILTYRKPHRNKFVTNKTKITNCKKKNKFSTYLANPRSRSEYPMNDKLYSHENKKNCIAEKRIKINKQILP